MVAKKRKHGGHAKAKKKSKAAAEPFASEPFSDAQQSAPQPQTNSEQPQEVNVAMSDASADAAGPSSEQPDILSAELRAELGGAESGGAAVVLGPRKKQQKKKEAPVPAEVLEAAVKMSKSKRKKMEAIAARKVKEARRADLYKSLEQQSLSAQQLQLMYSTSRMGHKETLRERLKRSMNRQKAGLTLSGEAQSELVHKKSHPGDESSSEDEDEAMESVESVTRAQSDITKATTTDSTVASTPAVKGESGQATEGKRTRRKKKKKAHVTHHSVPMQSAESESSSVASLLSTQKTVADRVTDAEESGTDATAERSASSQSAAMTKLEALREKNEERRRLKALAASQPKEEPKEESHRASSQPAEVYVPQPIVLKTAEEMRALSSQTTLAHKTTLVQLERKPEMQLARMQLPVCSSEQEIMEAISANDVIILCGETGSGKTTQVPQFLYEAGYGHPESPDASGMVGVTQPRRVAAVSTAKRVAEELNVPFGAPDGHVGYQIRYDAEHVGEHTRIKFMTDGILLKEIQQDFLLRQYAILLLDEAHERNVNTDILIGLLSRIAPLRAQMAAEEQEAFALLSPDEQCEAEKPIKPLKLVVMSATLRVEDFTQNERLFPSPPPVLRVDARQYPVTVHFNKRTKLETYVDEAYKKVLKIHKKLPEGGVLVFLTGQREILQLCRKLQRAYSASAREKRAAKLQSARAFRVQRRSRAPESSASAKDRILREHDDIEEEADLEDAQEFGAEDEDGAFELQEEDEREDEQEDEMEDLAVPYLHVLPLYSLLPNDDQMKVFEAPPENHRLVVVATNVAETSLTIPGVKYVVDAGRTKERVFDLNNGISSFDVQWISKASADQRAGRAGRTGPGHCYRLYSSAVYDTEFRQFSSPEIVTQPIDDLVLQMKAMGIHKVLQFPFPTPPDRVAVQKALETLANLGAVASGDDEAITGLGRALVKFPVAARFSKMLLLAQKLGLIEYTIAIVAGLSGHSPFIHAVDRREKEKDDEDKSEDRVESGKAEMEEMEKEWREAEEMRKHAQWVDQESDVLSLLRAAGAYAYTGGSSEFCKENHLHEKTMQNMLKLRQQLTRIVNRLYPEEEGFAPVALKPKMPPPDAETQVVLRQIVAAGFLDLVAKRVPAGTITEGTKIERNCAYMAGSGSVKEPVYIHPHSSVFTPNPTKLPQFVVYQHIMRSTRAYMKMVTAVEPEWLAAIGKNTPLCKYAPPLAEPAPFYHAELDEVQCYAKAQYGEHQWALPAARIAYPDHDEHEAKDGLAGKYRWFAKFLLDGQVVPGLLPFAAAVKEPSHLLIRKKFDKKIQLLVAKLQKSGVASRRALVAKWQEPGAQSKLFLKPELQAWMKDSHESAFAQAWTSIIKAAVQLEERR